jgi:uncharacterized membrane protein HdeD (DUF308 family)
MGLTYRKARSFIILLSGLAAIIFNNTLDGYSAMFGITLVVTALLGILNLFVYFDKPMNQKFLMELLLDGFSGIIIFTYSNSDEGFFLTVFAFWAFVNGLFYLTSGLLEKKNKSHLPFYTLIGIVMMIFGFIPLHFNNESLGSIIYLIGFAMIIYSSANLYLMFKRKTDIY